MQKRRKGEKPQRPSRDQALLIPESFPSTIIYPDNFPIVYRERSHLSGAGLKEVKEMIGHKDISMTDRYSHLTLAHKLQQQRRLARHYMNGARQE